MRHTDIRARIKAYHQRCLEQQVAHVEDVGPPSEERIARLRDDLAFCGGETTADYWDLMDPETGGQSGLPGYCERLGMPASLATTRGPTLLNEIRIARRDHLTAYLRFLEAQGSYEFSVGRSAEEERAPVEPPSPASLRAAVQKPATVAAG
ncbi:hypothetical protein [Amaricoccus sp. W119]|uniref:hypothetical protein n=1 Tax=Amaricoccus sp. W119 TaxID=3391833 RepID=UPI0039A48F52